MQAATTLDETEEAWTDFLIAVSTIYAKLEQGAKGHPRSEGWFGRKKRERKDDPLLRYLHYARNSNEHGIERVVQPTGPNMNGMTGEKLRVNERVPVTFEHIDRVTMQPSGLKGKGVFAGPTLKPIRAHDRRFGDYCDPPVEHLGSVIEFADFADSLGVAALPYLRLLVADAEALTGASSAIAK